MKRRIHIRRVVPYILIFVLSAALMLMQFFSPSKVQFDKKTASLVELSGADVLVPPLNAPYFSDEGSSYDGPYDFNIYSLPAIIEAYLHQIDVDPSAVAYFFTTDLLATPIISNGETEMIAASTTKLPLVMHYYDAIASGQISSQATLLYCADCDEENSPINGTYQVGDQVPLLTLLHSTALYSDNAASNILRVALGNYAAWRQIIRDYTPDIQVSEQWAGENLISANYAQALVSYLFKHQDQYADLIDDLRQATSSQFLQDLNENVIIADKYGWYDGYIHDYGIVYADSPYQIGVFTNNIADAESVIAKISRICSAYNLWLAQYKE